MSTNDPGSPGKDFSQALIEASKRHTSWRERLQWIRDRLLDPAFAPTPGQLATVAIYLRLLATGELRCEEDGRHFRPNHHAEAALHIETALERLSAPDTAWILRRIYPYLPSWGDEFRRSEPLTRIRDIAHRNDIPPDLKKEIKHRLQNKLHRCAGPEDLRTSAELLRRITAPGAGYAPAFVQEFQVFHGELQEFFNAPALERRLRALARSGDHLRTEAINAFLALKTEALPEGDGALDLLGRLTALRQLLVEHWDGKSAQRRSQLRLADIGLEDYAFVLLSKCANRLEDLARPGAWPRLVRAVAEALANLRLSLIEPEECAALHAELTAWVTGFSATDRFHLLRLLATLGRARRLTESYTDRIHRLFSQRVTELGRALGVADHALKVFGEGDIRGHLVFQLSRLVDLGIHAARQGLQLPPWEAIVTGEARGTLVQADEFQDLEGKPGPLLVLLQQADGDAEIPAIVHGIVLAHPMPHLSHLGVRARQAHVPFAACASPGHVKNLEPFLGKWVRLRVTPDDLFLEQAAVQDENHRVTAAVSSITPSPRHPVTLPDTVLTKQTCLLPLDEATPATCGAKAAGAGRLLTLAGPSGGLFRAPRGLALPFGVMEACLDRSPALQAEYQVLQERLPGTQAGDMEVLLERLRKLVGALQVPDEITLGMGAFFGPDARLAIRSSANGEDLEYLAGAGLYESVLNVSGANAAQAIAEVWASLWTRRATLSRMQAGIAHAEIRMAVLLQELVTPDLSFILHTVNPLGGNREEALVELAVGLGEVLASSSQPGTPYRMVCNRNTGATRLLACANFSFALRPAAPGAAPAIIRERLVYARVPLSIAVDFAERLGKRLATIAVFLEDKLGRPQDVEGVCVGEDIYIVQARPQQGLRPDS